MNHNSNKKVFVYCRCACAGVLTLQWWINPVGCCVVNAVGCCVVNAISANSVVNAINHVIWRHIICIVVLLFRNAIDLWRYHNNYKNKILLIWFFFLKKKQFKIYWRYQSTYNLHWNHWHYFDHQLVLPNPLYIYKKKFYWITKKKKKTIYHCYI